MEATFDPYANLAQAVIAHIEYANTNARDAVEECAWHTAAAAEIATIAGRRALANRLDLRILKGES